MLPCATVYVYVGMVALLSLSLVVCAMCVTRRLKNFIQETSADKKLWPYYHSDATDLVIE
jgi:hypothetical protein